MASPSRSPHLLHADEEQLDRAAMMLRTGTAFVIAVAPKDLWPAALGRLRAKVPGPEMPPPVEITEAWAMLDALVEQTKRKDRVLSLTLAGDVGSALDGLNLHREKTLKGGPVLLWLEGVDALMQVRERAPDAFSFRATMVMLQGDGGALPVASGEELEMVTRIRKRLKRAKTPLERAGLETALAEQLVGRGRLVEAESAARAALNSLGEGDSAESKVTRSLAFVNLSHIARGREMIRAQLRWAHLSRAECAKSASVQRLDLEVHTCTSMPGPYELDIATARAGLELAERYGLGPEALGPVLQAASSVAAQLGDLRLARRRANAYADASRHLSALDRAMAQNHLGRVADIAGQLTLAESCFRQSIDGQRREGSAADDALDALARLLVARGELESAAAAAAAFSGAFPVELQCFQAEIMFQRGAVSESLSRWREAGLTAEACYADGAIMHVLEGIVHTIEDSTGADVLAPNEREAALRDLARGETLVLGPTDDDGPAWHPIQLLDLRARLLTLTPDSLPEALDLSRQALDLAHKTYPDLLPETGRLLADHLLLAAQPDEALAAVADVEPYAAANGFLGERARLLSARLLAHVLRGDAPHTISPHLAALREACAATDSPRITAETLRDLAKRLPPTCTTPDPYALAEEAHDLFLAMPMPAQDARCMEIMGDVLLARGDRDEARARYLMARGRLQRYGLGLRLPLLEKKLAALA